MSEDSIPIPSRDSAAADVLRSSPLVAVDVRRLRDLLGLGVLWVRSTAGLAVTLPRVVSLGFRVGAVMVTPLSSAGSPVAGV